jgi:hypothetical protein
MNNDEIIRKWIDVSIGGTPFHQYNDVKGGISKGIDYPTLKKLLNNARVDERRKVLDENWEADCGRKIREILKEMKNPALKDGVSKQAQTSR